MVLQIPPAGLAVPRSAAATARRAAFFVLPASRSGSSGRRSTSCDGPRRVDHRGRREGEPAVDPTAPPPTPPGRRGVPPARGPRRGRTARARARPAGRRRRSGRLTASGRRRGYRSERARQNVSATRSGSIRSATATSAAHVLARSHGLRVGDVAVLPRGPEGVHRLAQQGGRVGRLFRLRQAERAHPEGVPAHHRVDRRGGQPARPGKVDRGHPVHDADNIMVVLVGILDHAEHPLGRGGVLAGELVGDVAVVPVVLAGVGEALRELQGRVEVDLAELLGERPLGVGGPRGVGQLLGVGLDLAEQGLALLGEAHVEPVLGDLAR